VSRDTPRPSRCAVRLTYDEPETALQQHPHVHSRSQFSWQQGCYLGRGSSGRGSSARGSRGGTQKVWLLENVDELLIAHCEHGHRFDTIDIAASWSTLGKLVRKSSERRRLGPEPAVRLGPLAEQTLRVVPKLPSRALANTVHGIASVQANVHWHAGEPLWCALAERGCAVVKDAEPQQLANTAWAYARARHAAPALLDAIATAAMARVDDFSPQALANMAWAYATARQPAPALMDAIAVAAVVQIAEFNPQDLANTAWAYATARHEVPELMDAIAVAVAVRAGEFQTQNLANTAWAYATAGHGSPALMDAIAAVAAARVGKFKPQELANTAWAYATLGHAAPALMDAIAEAAVKQVRSFRPQALANTAWAYATVRHPARAMMTAIAAASVKRIGSFKPQELSNLAWAYATAGHAAPSLMDAIAVMAVRRIHSFKSQELANLAWAYATAGHSATALMDAIAAVAVKRLSQFKTQELANLAWGLAAADVCAPNLFGTPLFVQRCAAFERAFAPAHLCQLHQWQLWRDECGSAWPPLSPSLSRRCRAAFSTEVSRPSLLQLEVVDTLHALGLTPRQELCTQMGYSLDAVVVVAGHEVAVEVDGPTHFVGHAPTGATVLKRRQLRAAGWRLLSVPYWEWHSLSRNDPAARQEYVSHALCAMLVVPRGS